jgi:hypothetical protein
MHLRLIAPLKAGTYKVSVFTTNYSSGLAASDGPTVTWTITVNALDTAATAATTSTLRPYGKNMADGTAEGTDSSVSASYSNAASVTTPAATIWIKQKNGAGTADESMTVTVDGPGFVNDDSATKATSGKSITVKNVNNISGNYTAQGLTPIFLWASGVAGKSTVTIKSVSGVTLGTETVTFFGLAKTIELDTLYGSTIRSGGFETDTIDIVVKDVSGNLVTGQTGFSMVSSDTTKVSSASSSACTEYATAPGYYGCSATSTVSSVSGDTASLTYRIVDPNVTTSTAYITYVHAVKMASTVSTVTLTLDKATYSPGEKMILTATAVDASGNKVYDGVAAPSSFTANKAIGGTITMTPYYDGVSTSKKASLLDPRVSVNGNDIYAPNASGSFTITYVYGLNSSKVATVTATVGDDAATSAANAASDAAAEAIDAANAATDAANLAAEAADAATVAAEEARDAADAATAAVEELATQVATLMAALKAQITTLANTVAKIAKKVRA